MYAGEAPPSMSSVAVRAVDQNVGQNNQQLRSVDNPQIQAIAEDGQPPSMTALGHGQGSSINQIQAGAVGRNLGQPDGAVQPPSVGAMAVGHVGVSLTSGGGDPYVGAQPPSRNAVGEREGSRTGASSTGYQFQDAQQFAGMSLTGTNFRNFYPNAFYKGNDDN